MFQRRLWHTDSRELLWKLTAKAVKQQHLQVKLKIAKSKTSGNFAVGV